MTESVDPATTVPGSASTPEPSVQDAQAEQSEPSSADSAGDEREDEA